MLKSIRVKVESCVCKLIKIHFDRHVLRSGHLLICLLGIGIVVSMMYPTYNLRTVYAMPPSSRFSADDIQYADQVDSPNTQGYFLAKNGLPIDISSISYFSDGNYLNATLWLSAPMLADRHSEYLNLSLNYVMEIYDVRPDNRLATNLLYSIVIYPEEDGSWSKRIIEYEPGTRFTPEAIKAYDLEEEAKAYGLEVDATYKILKIYRNITGFFQDNNAYVVIDLPLNDIGNPADVKLSFRTYAEKDENLISDVTYQFDAPSRRNLLVVKWPTSLEVRAGETVRGQVPINILEATGTGNITLQQSIINENYTLEFRPNTIDHPLNGTISSDFLLTVAPHVKNKVLPVQVNITETPIGNPISNPWNETFYITVLPPLTELDMIGKSFIEFATYTFAFYWIPFGISSIFGFWLSRKIDKGELPRSLIEKLRPKDILTMNASVVAGVLIFLTVGGTELFQSGMIVHISILTASIVYPFAISAIRILTTGDLIAGIKFTIPGFVFLMVSVVLIAIFLGNQNPQNI